MKITIKKFPNAGDVPLEDVSIYFEVKTALKSSSKHNTNDQMVGAKCYKMPQSRVVFISISVCLSLFSKNHAVGPALCNLYAKDRHGSSTLIIVQFNINCANEAIATARHFRVRHLGSLLKARHSWESYALHSHIR